MKKLQQKRVILIPSLAAIILLATSCLVVRTYNPQTSSQQGAPPRPSTTETHAVATISQNILTSTSTLLAPTTSPVGEPTRQTETMEATTVPTQMPLKITIIYDNMKYDPALTTAWGFSALVEYQGETTLFDTGGDGATLLDNMQILGINPNNIEQVVLSHAHSDHTGGVIALLELGIQPTIYLLPSFPAVFEHQLGQFTSVVEVSPGQTIAKNLMTTGEMVRNVPEQALVIKTGSGLVVVTGCAHPGIVEIVKQVREMFDDPVYLVMGGFHLGGKSQSEIEHILRDFRHLGVEQVAPSHCTGEKAIAMFAREYEENFIQAGVGKVIQLSDGTE